MKRLLSEALFWAAIGFVGCSFLLDLALRTAHEYSKKLGLQEPSAATLFSVWTI